MKFVSCLVVFCTCLCNLSNLNAFEGRRWSRSAVNRYAQEVWKQKRWSQIDEGCQDSPKNEIISVTFKCKEAVELSQARQLLVNELFKIFSMIKDSQSKAISQTNGPFQVDNLSFTLTFQPDKKSSNPPWITLASHNNGRLHYFSNDPSGSKKQKVHEESLEEAVNILKPKR